MRPPVSMLLAESASAEPLRRGEQNGNPSTKATRRDETGTAAAIHRDPNVFSPE